MKKILLLSFTLIFFLFSCKNKNQNIASNNNNIIIDYAENFQIDTNENVYVLTVKNRFNNSLNEKYFLYKNSEKKNKKNSFNIPVKKIICLSSTYCAFIKILSVENSIIGISGTKYIYDSAINKKIESKEIIEVGYENQLNYEKIISLKPDVVFAYSIDNSSNSNYQKLIDVGIPIIYVSEFLESKPLGRSEWIKFFACFFDKLNESQIIFDSIANNYNNIKNKITRENIKRPKVITGLPYKGSWWLPSKSSFFANFIRDAGADYLFEKENNNNESIPVSMEHIFEIAKEVNFWLNTNQCVTKKEIIENDNRLIHFNAYNKAKIYNNVKRMNKNGGSDFWESGIVHPDIILSDLYSIFHNKGNNLIYYLEVK